MERVDDSDQDTIEFEVEPVSSSSSCVSLNAHPEAVEDELQQQQQVVGEPMAQDTQEEQIVEAASLGDASPATDKRPAEVLDGGNDSFETGPPTGHADQNPEHVAQRDETSDRSTDNEGPADNATTEASQMTEPLSPTADEIQLTGQPRGGHDQVEADVTPRTADPELPLVESDNGPSVGGLPDSDSNQIDSAQNEASERDEQQSSEQRPPEQVDNLNAFDPADGFVRSQVSINLSWPADDSQELEERIPIDLKLEQEEHNNNDIDITDSDCNQANKCHEAERPAEEQPRIEDEEPTPDAGSAAHADPEDLSVAPTASDHTVGGLGAPQADLDSKEPDGPAGGAQQVSGGEGADDADAQTPSDMVGEPENKTVPGCTSAAPSDVDNSAHHDEGGGGEAKDCELVGGSNGWTLVRESLARMADGWLLIDESEALEIEPVVMVEPSRCVDGSSGTGELASGQVQAADAADDAQQAPDSRADSDTVGQPISEQPGGGGQPDDHPGRQWPEVPASGDTDVLAESRGTETPLDSGGAHDGPGAMATTGAPETALAGRRRLTLDVSLAGAQRGPRLSFSEDDSLEREFDDEPEFQPRQVVVKRNAEPRNEYELGAELGKGRFGTVFRCRELATGRALAAKFIRLRRAEERRDVEREVAIMGLLQHRRLLQLFDAFDDGRLEMCLVTELVEGGELFERIVDDDFELTERKAAVFVRQICEGADYMQSQRVVHLDMKPENILCLSRTGYRIKLIDFGLARRLEPGEPLRVMFGTPDFAAPEVLAYEPVSLETDMWSVGVICYVLLSGLSPFMGDSDLETMANVLRATYDFEAQAFEPISELARDFIGRLLVREPARRLRPAQCLAHPWLQRGGARPEPAAGSPAPPSPADSSAETTLSVVSLDKRNLKRYVVRRKWHKTVHAIMALGRMGANLKLRL